jgi:Flp pilus assembly protein TadG
VVEFALMLPLLVLLVFATIETCSMIYLEQSLKIAAYEGARIALVPGTTGGNVMAAANQVLEDREVAGGTIAISPSNYPDAKTGTYIRVTVSAPATGNSVVGAWFYGGRTMTSSVEVMKET